MVAYVESNRAASEVHKMVKDLVTTEIIKEVRVKGKKKKKKAFMSVNQESHDS